MYNIKLLQAQFANDYPKFSRFWFLCGQPVVIVIVPRVLTLYMRAIAMVVFNVTTIVYPNARITRFNFKLHWIVLSSWEG